jgi:hypothetical protein
LAPFGANGFKEFKSGGVMARREATNRRAKMATMREVLQRAKETEHFTSEPVINEIVSNKAGSEGAKLNDAVSFLIEAIIHLPRRVKTLRERLARAEAESLRAACQTFEVWAKRVREDSKARIQLEIAVKNLDAALVRFAVMAS